MPNNSGSVDLSGLRQQAEAGAGTEEQTQEPGQPTTVLTAFAVIVGFDGDPQVVSYEHDDVDVQNRPTPDMVFAACSTILKDIQSQETAQAAAQLTASIMVQQARAMAEQQQAAQMRAGLGDLRHG